MGVIDSVKEVASLVQKVGDMDLYRKILDLQAEVLQISQSLMDRESKARELEAEVGRLRDALELKPKMVRRGEAYYAISADGLPTGDPYCSHCFEVLHQAVHIHQSPVNRASSVCPACKNVYQWQRRAETPTADAAGSGSASAPIRR
jgi:hypothetical protein